MQEKFDQIIDFADLWDFIDVPIRNYSSGMSARLGFAIATDVEPDVLILDEVLSVGDEAFQRKCLFRMGGFREMGATIIIVSHNMDTILEMCQRTIWLNQGRVQKIGETGNASRQQVLDRFREYA